MAKRRLFLLSICLTQVYTFIHRPYIVRSSLQSTKIPIDVILQELDARDVRYPPDATRQDLEKLYLARKNEETTEDLIKKLDEENIRYAPDSTKEDLKSLLRQQQSQARKLRQQSTQWNEKSIEKVFGSIPKKVPSETLHQARRIARKANDWLKTDLDGVRDVCFEYVKREPLPGNQSNQTIHEATMQSMGKRRIASRTPPPPRPPQPTMPTRRRPSRPKMESPARPERQPRKIYSPYNRGKSKDMIDQVGEFIANTAEDLILGPEDEETPPKQAKRHWKDRMEERIDTVLGVHQDSEFYKKWAEREDDDVKQEEGYDALSIARGRRPKKHHRPVAKKYDKPFWEEEGNLVSLVLGRSKNGGSLFYERLLDPTKGSLVNLFRSVLSSILLVATYLFRWASVRDALPQPVVVMGVCTAGICAKRKLLAMGVALIAMRTIGELIHGALYDNEDWNEDEGSEPAAA